MMTHLSDGAIRRLQDEPFALDEASRAHQESCAECRARGEAIRADAAATAIALETPDAVLDTAAALRRFQARSTAAPRRRFDFRLPRVLVAAAAVVVIAFTLSSTGLADSFLRIFEAKQFTPVTVSAADMSALPDLSTYGTMTFSPSEPQPVPVANVAAARAATGLPVLLPVTLPSGASLARVATVAQTTATFTFSASLAQANAARLGKTLPPMPAKIDGAKLIGQAGPATIVMYSLPSSTGSGEPALIVAESRTPTISSDGVTVQQLRDYLLAQPGISPALAAQLQSIGDPSTTLPIPIPVAKARSSNVQVQGVTGLLVNDGILSGVIWQKDGIVHGVAGTVSTDQLMAVANSLR